MIYLLLALFIIGIYLSVVTIKKTDYKKIVNSYEQDEVEITSAMEEE
jgi:hypothetical protein